jgi:hypothetical protein
MSRLSLCILFTLSSNIVLAAGQTRQEIVAACSNCQAFSDIVSNSNLSDEFNGDETATYLVSNDFGFTAQFSDPGQQDGRYNAKFPSKVLDCLRTNPAAKQVNDILVGSWFVSSQSIDYFQLRSELYQSGLPNGRSYENVLFLTSSTGLLRAYSADAANGGGSDYSTLTQSGALASNGGLIVTTIPLITKTAESAIKLSICGAL